MGGRLYFRQLLGGRDIALLDEAGSFQEELVFGLAQQMRNFMYLIGDYQTKECFAVDAW